MTWLKTIIATLLISLCISTANAHVYDVIWQDKLPPHKEYVQGERTGDNFKEIYDQVHFSYKPPEDKYLIIKLKTYFWKEEAYGKSQSK